MRVFISYTRSDRAFVSQLAERLKADGIDVWWDQWEIGIGDSIVDKINSGLAEADILAIVLSGNAVRSRWVREELNAMMSGVIEKKASVMPVLLEGCEIPPLLAHRRYANFADDPTSAYDELLSSLKKSKAKSEQTSSDALGILHKLMTGWSLRLAKTTSEDGREALYSQMEEQLRPFQKRYQFPPLIFSFWVRLCVKQQRFLELVEFIETGGRIVGDGSVDSQTSRAFLDWLVQKMGE
jgi:hypothetical protein